MSETFVASGDVELVVVGSVAVSVREARPAGTPTSLRAAAQKAGSLPFALLVKVNERERS